MRATRCGGKALCCPLNCSNLPKIQENTGVPSVDSSCLSGALLPVGPSPIVCWLIPSPSQPWGCLPRWRRSSQRPEPLAQGHTAARQVASFTGQLAEAEAETQLVLHGAGQAPGLEEGVSCPIPLPAPTRPAHGVSGSRAEESAQGLPCCSPKVCFLVTRSGGQVAGAGMGTVVALNVQALGPCF